jgi:TRAP-type C4-dicarboxylate transport system permease small subunit
MSAGADCPLRRFLDEENAVSTTSSSAQSNALSRLVTSVADVGSGIAVFMVIVIVLTQVVGRLLGMPFSWTEEATRVFFMWMVFLGMGASMRTADAARVTVFLNWLPKFCAPLFMPIYVVSCITFFALMGWTGVGMVRQQMMMNETFATLAIPTWIVGLMMPVSAVIGILAVISSVKNYRDVIDAKASPSEEAF